MQDSVKKCPQCGQWSVWQQHIKDICEHCGSLLSPSELKDQEERLELQKKNSDFKVTLISVNPGDSLPVVFIKRVIQAFQLTFMAIISFLVWLATAIAG